MEPYKKSLSQQESDPEQSRPELSNAELFERTSKAGTDYDRFTYRRTERLDVLQAYFDKESDDFHDKDQAIVTLRNMAKVISREQLDGKYSDTFRQRLQSFVYSVDDSIASSSETLGTNAFPKAPTFSSGLSEAGVLERPSITREKAGRASKKIEYWKFAIEMDDVEKEARATKVEAEIESPQITFLRRMAGLCFVLKKREEGDRRTNEYRSSRPGQYQSAASPGMPPEWKEKNSRFGHMQTMMRECGQQAQESLPAGLLSFDWTRDCFGINEAGLKRHEWWDYPSGASDDMAG